MSSMREQLQPGEEVVYVAHPTRIVLYLVLFITVAVAIATAASFQMSGTLDLPEIIGLVVLIPLVLILLQKWILLASNQWVLTNRRVIKQTGLFAKRSVTSQLDKINTVEHRQTLWGRMLGYGEVEVDTASETGTTTFSEVSDPIRFKNAILEASEARRGGVARPGMAMPLVASGADRLRQLKALHDDGLISAEEYEVKRQKLMEEL